MNILKRLDLFFKEFIRNKNVRLVLGGFTLFIFVFTIYVQQIKEIEAPNAFQLEQRYKKWHSFIDEYQEMKEPLPQYTMVYELYKEWNRFDEMRYQGWTEQNYEQYAEGTAEWYAIGLQVAPPMYYYSARYLINDRYYAEFDAAYNYAKISKFMALLQSQQKMINQKMVAFQSSLSLLPKLFTHHLAYILLLAISLLAFLLVTSMRAQFLIMHSPTQRYGTTWLSTLLIGGVAAVLFAAVLFSVTILTGNLHLTYQIPVLDVAHFNAEQIIGTSSVFRSWPLWQYLLLCFGFYLLWSVVIARACLLLALLLPKKPLLFLLPAVLLSGSFFLGLQRWWGTVREVRYNPLLYVDFGKLITGETAFYLGNNQLTLQNGLLTIGGIFLLLEVLLVLIIFVKGGRAFDRIR